MTFSFLCLFIGVIIGILLERYLPVRYK